MNTITEGNASSIIAGSVEKGYARITAYIRVTNDVLWMDNTVCFRADELIHHSSPIGEVGWTSQKF